MIHILIALMGIATLFTGAGPTAAPLEEVEFGAEIVVEEIIVEEEPEIIVPVMMF